MSLFRLLTDFDGRIGLRQFWLGSAVVALALFTIQQGLPELMGRDARQVIVFSQAFALFPWAALAAKRASDRGSTALFGILLICMIVLPGHAKPLLSIAWGPALDTVSRLAWFVALVDLGMMPSARDENRRGEALVAMAAGGDKAGAWTANAPSISMSPTPSP